MTKTCANCSDATPGKVMAGSSPARSATARAGTASIAKMAGSSTGAVHLAFFRRGRSAYSATGSYSSVTGHGLPLVESRIKRLGSSKRSLSWMQNSLGMKSASAKRRKQG